MIFAAPQPKRPPDISAQKDLWKLIRDSYLKLAGLKPKKP